MRCLLDLPLWFRREAWRFLFFSFPAVSMISCPHPPSPPFPLRGRGSLKVYFAGGFAPGTPALNCLRHLQTPPCRSPAVVCPAGRRVDEHWRYPAGGLPGRSAARPALSFICCPHPPAPLPGGKGAFSFHMQGASPLASPRPSRKRHGLHLRCRCPAVVCPAGRRLTLPLALFLSPIPPPPFPLRGRGAGGIGGRIKTKGRVGRRQRRTPPCPQFCPGSAAGNLYGGSYNAGSGLMPGAERQAPGNNFRK